MTFKPSPARAGETVLEFDATQADDARLAFIGRIRSPWRERGDCPKNLRMAREQGCDGAFAEIDAPFRAALHALEAGQWIFFISWLHQARRDLALQMPRHAEKLTGTFSLRSPVRPNPIGLHLVRLVSVDLLAGRLQIDAIDTIDGTPLLDIKPYVLSVDRPPEE